MTYLDALRMLRRELDIRISRIEREMLEELRSNKPMPEHGFTGKPKPSPKLGAATIEDMLA